MASKSKRTFTSNKGIVYHFSCRYAKKTPDGFWEDVCDRLAYMGVFDGIFPSKSKRC